MGLEKGVGQTQVVRKELRKAESSQVCRFDSITRRNAYYPDFAYRLDGKKKCLQVLSVVGPSKFVQGAQVEGVSCFNRLKAEGDSTCIEEYGKRLGYVYSNAPSSTIFFTAIFKYVFGGGNVKWVNPLPFDAGAEDLVLSLARDAREWVDFFQRNISKLKDSPTHTTLSVVLQLDVINCEAFTGRVKMPLEVRFAFEGQESQGAAKKQKGVRFRSDRSKWVAEYNPPGKKNNKISLGEYDTLAEAARAADAGMFCYGSKTSGYNFPDSPSVLQRAPQPVSVQDKEAVRRWARDFAKLTAGPPSLPLVGNGTPASLSLQIGNGAPSNSCLTFETPKPAVAISLPPCPSAPQSMSNSAPSLSNAEVSLDPYNVPLYDSDCSSAATLHLEDVTEYMDMAVSLNSVDHQAMLHSLGQRAMQINGSLPQDEMSYPEEALFRPNDVDYWNAGSPMFGPEGMVPISRTLSDTSGMVTDDLFQSIMSCNPSCNTEVERCNIRLIR
ncbi:hypothetical protein M758_7G035900 [Ceratodon purpureus]|nr:hypothetical protein M758_7G035900 [Ceratodon purpureus]